MEVAVQSPNVWIIMKPLASAYQMTMEYVLLETHRLTMHVAADGAAESESESIEW